MKGRAIRRPMLPSPEGNWDCGCIVVVLVQGALRVLYHVSRSRGPSLMLAFVQHVLRASSP